MTLPDSHMSFQAEFEILDRGLDSDKGVRLSMIDRSQAYTYRHRLNHARNLDRRKNMETYEKGSPLYGRSEYDKLVMRIRQDTEDGWWLYVEKNETYSGYLEEIQ